MEASHIVSSPTIVKNIVILNILVKWFFKQTATRII